MTVRQIKSFLKVAALGLAAASLAPSALAQATRTWVSGVGDDANPCSRTAPCKTFAGAISKTAANGIINVIDPGGFGAVTITKSITIDGAGAHAGVLASLTNGIDVNAAGITVVLRNLSIEGVDTGLVGVNFVQGARLTVENCRIFGFRGGSAMGIRMVSGGTLVVRDTTISDNGIGVHLETPGAPVVATLDNVHIEDAANCGVQTAGLNQVFLTIRRSTISNNGLYGVHAAGPNAIVNIVDSSTSFNGPTGVNAGYPGALVRLSGNTLVNNANALGRVTGATIESDQTNRIAGGSVSSPNGTFPNQ